MDEDKPVITSNNELSYCSQVELEYVTSKRVKVMLARQLTALLQHVNSML